MADPPAISWDTWHAPEAEGVYPEHPEAVLVGSGKFFFFEFYLEHLIFRFTETLRKCRDFP